MRRRVVRKRDGPRRRRRGIRERITRFVRALFSSGGSGDDPRDFPSGGIGVREPRVPRHPTRSGAIALEAPPEETRDVWAVGEESGA